MAAEDVQSAGQVESYAIVSKGREGHLDGVLTILDGLTVAMEIAAELRQRGTPVTVMSWTPPT